MPQGVVHDIRAGDKRILKQLRDLTSTEECLYGDPSNPGRGHLRLKYGEISEDYLDHISKQIRSVSDTDQYEIYLGALNHAGHAGHEGSGCNKHDWGMKVDLDLLVKECTLPSIDLVNLLLENHVSISRTLFVSRKDYGVKEAKDLVSKAYAALGYPDAETVKKSLELLRDESKKELDSDSFNTLTRFVQNSGLGMVIPFPFFGQ